MLEGSSGWVNTDVAADALGVSARTVRNYILNGDLVARKETDGLNARYLVSVESLQELRKRRKDQDDARGKSRRGSSRSESSADATTELVRETAGDMLKETLASLETHIAQNAELRARLEFTERAESTLQEALRRERRQHQDDVKRERSERQEAQQRIEQLTQEHARLQEELSRAQEELEVERSKGFWRRLSGS